MTQVLASHTHSTSTFLMPWGGEGVSHVMVWAKHASRSVAKLQKTTVRATRPIREGVFLERKL